MFFQLFREQLEQITGAMAIPSIILPLRNAMSHRYPWESTTHSTPQSKFKYSSPSSNLFSSTSNPYKRVTSFATTPATKYTYTTTTTASYLYANKYKTKVNNSNDNNSYSKNGYAAGTTTRRYTNYSYYTVSPMSKINDLNYPKISPFRHKGTASTGFAASGKRDQNGLQSDARGKRNLHQKPTICTHFPLGAARLLLFVFSLDIVFDVKCHRYRQRSSLPIFSLHSA